MKKPDTTDATPTPLSFYRPHKRVVFDGLVLDPKTGEYKRPVSLVKQSFVAECDINNILKQYSVTGQLKHINAAAAQGAFLDLPDDLDFQNSLNVVADGERAFATLPSKIRDRFHNSPTVFLQFLFDPRNQDEAISLGLATKRPVPAPQEPQAPASSPASPPSPEGS